MPQITTTVKNRPCFPWKRLCCSQGPRDCNFLSSSGENWSRVGGSRKAISQRHMGQATMNASPRVRHGLLERSATSSPQGLLRGERVLRNQNVLNKYFLQTIFMHPEAWEVWWPQRCNLFYVTLDKWLLFVGYSFFFPICRMWGWHWMAFLRFFSGSKILLILILAHRVTQHRWDWHTEADYLN